MFVQQAKAGGKKASKVTLKISPRGIVLQDGTTSKLLENVSIYRHVYPTLPHPPTPSPCSVRLG